MRSDLTMSKRQEQPDNTDINARYLRFAAMIATSMVLMFLLMYLHSYQILEHAWFSETRLFMTLIMGGGMVIVMLLYMLHMYTSKARNAAVILTGLALIATGVVLVRSQITVSDTDYMEGMIPHHSIAVLTSERAQIEDPRVRELADKILAAQRREIKEMEWLISDIREYGIATSEAEASSRAVPAFDATPD